MAEGESMELQKELASLLNKNSEENVSNTPDWVLAQFMLGCLNAFNVAVQQRENWYGRDPRPTLTDDEPSDVGERPDYGHLVPMFHHIATSCSHTGDGAHIHEPTTGGERWCGPCYAWRCLNGSPDALD